MRSKTTLRSVYEKRSGVQRAGNERTEEESATIAGMRTGRVERVDKTIAIQFGKETRRRNVSHSRLDLGRFETTLHRVAIESHETRNEGGNRFGRDFRKGDESYHAVSIRERPGIETRSDRTENRDEGYSSESDRTRGVDSVQRSVLDIRKADESRTQALLFLCRF